MNIKKRSLYDTIVPKYLENDEIIVITGMRRVGKTTLCRSIYDEILSKNKVFLDIENPIDQKLFDEEDFSNIIINLKSKYGINAAEKIYLFLDEVQSMPGIVRAIKYLYDHFNIKFFLTGSSSFYLKNLFPESLAGRKKVFELYPLSFQEFLVFKGKEKVFYETFEEMEVNKSKIMFENFKTFYDEYLEYGAFPGVVIADDIVQKKDRLEDIFKSYFEKEVKIMSEFRDIAALRDLLLILLERSGSKLDIGKLASEVGVSRITVSNYLEFLEGTYFVHFISPYSTNVDREVSGTKKVYICDTGILNHFSKVNSGSILENSIFLACKRRGKVNYYQKRHSETEIDILFPEDAIALEVKTRGTREDLRRLRKASVNIGFSKHWVVSKEFNPDPGFLCAMDL